MKAITILEPWASLIAYGEKTIETRSWPTKHRGLIAIHAGKSCDDKKIRPIVAKAAQYGIHIPELKFRYVIAIAELVDCIKMTREYIRDIPEPEKSFGWFEVDRYGWVFKNVRPIEPVPAKGQLSLWDWKDCPGFEDWAIGTKVRMVNCAEAEKHKGKIWTTRSKPWLISCGIQVVSLEGYIGGFATECLEIVK